MIVKIELIGGGWLGGIKAGRGWRRRITGLVQIGRFIGLMG